jgi:DNA-binding transcriptional LysR family regulator
MTLEALRCFCAVVETGSFKAAADRTFRSQPAVSQQVKSLERELGHTLLDRRSGAPTAVGELLYRRAHDLLLAAASIQEEIGDIDEAWSRELRVGSSDTTALHILPPYIRRFAQLLPDTRLATVSRSTDAIVEHVLQGDVDLGVVTLPIGHAALEEKRLWNLKLALVVPRGHPLSKRKVVNIQRLGDLPYLKLSTETRTGALLWNYFRNAGFEPQVAMDSGSFEVIKRYITEGLGVSLLPEQFIAPADGLATIRVAGLPTLCIGAIWRRGAYQSRATRQFLALLEAASVPAGDGAAPLPLT